MECFAAIIVFFLENSKGIMRISYFYTLYAISLAYGETGLENFAKVFLIKLTSRGDTENFCAVDDNYGCSEDAMKTLSAVKETLKKR